jgi:ATP-binding cassette subfamily B (MDR/TAP) protein 1
VEASLTKKGHLAGFLFGLSQFVLFAQNAVIFYVAALFTQSDGLTFRDMFLAMFAIMMSAMATGRASHFLPDVGAGKNACRRIFAVLDEKSSIDPESCGSFHKPLTGEITFQNVSFKYPTRSQKVLNNISFTVKPGQKIALVGPSGCGKSTIIQMLQRFYDPDEGRVLIDGVDMREYDIHGLRKQIGIVSQEPVLFNGTIEYNIKYTNENATDDEMRNAARQANALDFIEKNEFQELEKDKKEDFGTGFRRKVGPKGSQISGGQKQRIAIARAIMKNPKIYLFDEATSALDNVSEKIVQDSLNALMVNHTSITIAHRLSTIKDVDEILVLHDGQIIERGTYAQLIQSQGVFYKMEKGILDKA